MRDLRRQYRFVTMIMGCAAQNVSGKDVTLSTQHKQCSLPVIMVNRLISQGVLMRAGDAFVPTSEARSWLKRQRLALLSQEPPVVSSPKPAPILSENDTILRLARKAKGEQEAFLAAHHVLVANRVSTLIAKSQLRPNITQNFSILRQPGHSTPSDATDLSDMAIDCRKRLEQLVWQLPKDCAGVVVDVCGFDKGLQQVEFERRWPRRSAKLVLRMGLDHAAEFWKIGAFAQGHNEAPRW